jgi:catechol 2,3-dioxygenase-like lactoylglutathione lyase family enzyme
MAQSLKSVNAITLFVEDVQRSKGFYESVFDVVGVDEDETTVILPFDNVFLRLLRRDAAEQELLGRVPLAAADSGASFELATFVEDADALCAELGNRGVPIAYGPVDRPWGVRHVAIRDPDGHLWVFGADIPED